MNVLSPFLDSIETVGIQKTKKKDVNNISERTFFNRKRGNKISSLARKNAAEYKELQKWIMQMDTNHPAFEDFINFRNRLQNCCSHTLVRVHHEPNTIEFIGAHTCKHKCCHVCNSNRSKQLRRKYNMYLDKNEFVDRKTGEIFKREDFDFMHLTLTVPHTENGYKGKRWYAAELIKEFNYLRKKNYWQESVFAGEFGIEVTKNKSGLHIHLHSLLVVRKFPQSRNLLHKWILQHWNMQTATDSATRKKFTVEQLEAIKKGNKTLNETDLKSLNPTGSTLIGLESLYVMNAKKIKSTDRWDAEKGMWKHYVDVNEPKQFMYGIMECIKYHFEPMALNTHTGFMDYELLQEIIPAIKGKPLYRKFGNFHGVSELNINDNIEDEINEVISETAHENVLHPETNQPVTPDSYDYVMLSAKSIFYDRNNNFKPFVKRSAKKTKIDCFTLREAMLYMTDQSWRGQITAKNKQEVEFMQYYPDPDEFQLN